MRSMRISALVLTAALGLSAPTLLRADDATPPAGPATSQPHHERHGPMGPIMAALKATTPTVTDEETAKIKPIMEAGREKAQAWFTAHKDELEKLHADMKAAKDANDKDKMEALHTKMQELMKDAPKPKDVVDQILPILTADQQTSFKAELEKIHKEHGGPGGPGGHHHPKDGAAGGAPAQQ